MPAIVRSSQVALTPSGGSGHVGWQRSEYGGVQCGKEDDAGLRADPARAHIEPASALIGTPGENKTELPTGVLPEAWRRAMADVAHATSVVFVDMPRLKGMIEWTKGWSPNQVRVHEMWCQDFFAVFERDGL